MMLSEYQGEKKTDLRQLSWSLYTIPEMMGVCHNYIKTLMVLFWLWKFVCDCEIAWKFIGYKVSIRVTWQGTLTKCIPAF